MEPPEIRSSGRGGRSGWPGYAWDCLPGLLDASLAYLGGRVSGEMPLTQHQMVRGSLASALTNQLEIRSVLSGAGPGEFSAQALGQLHDQITRTDRVLLRLLGAGGFLADGPGQSAYASDLLACAYGVPDQDQGSR